MYAKRSSIFILHVCLLFADDFAVLFAFEWASVDLTALPVARSFSSLLCSLITFDSSESHSESSEGVQQLDSCAKKKLLLMKHG